MPASSASLSGEGSEDLKEITIRLDDEVWTRLSSEVKAYMLVRGGTPGTIQEAFLTKLLEVVQRGEKEYTFQFVRGA